MTSSIQVSLSSPLTLGDVDIRNRVAMSALTRNRAYPDTVPNEVMVKYYQQRARSAGLITSEGILTSPQGTTWPYAPGLWSKEQVEGWKKITEAVHSVGGRVFAQLWHGNPIVGRIAHNDMSEQKKAGKPVPGPSAVKARGYEDAYKRFGLDPTAGYSKPTALEDPTVIVTEFREAAISAKEAGFDGVELHAANGYLIHQFLDNTVNQRNDKWGGGVENRARLGLEIVDALVGVFGPGRVGVKVSPAGGYNDVGMPLEDTVETFSYFLKEIVAKGVAYVALAQYNELLDVVIEGEKRGTPHDVLATFGPIIKASNGKTKLLLNSGLTPERAKELVSKDQIDGAVFGMSWITNPDLQTRIEKGLPINYNFDFGGFFVWKGDDVGDAYTSYADAE